MPVADSEAEHDQANRETEDDLDEGHGAEHARVHITGSDWTLETLVNQLRKGNIDLNPRFQRRGAWTDERKSRLIESIVLNFPIPQIILAEREEGSGTFIVLDGKQRLLTIRQFCADHSDERDTEYQTLALSKLKVCKHLNGHSYRTLADDPDRIRIVNAFDNYTLRAVVIRRWPEEHYLNRVFLRLNTGSVQLSSQELRQALYPGPFTDFLDDFVGNSEALHRALGLTGPDFRMRDNEIMLRYLAFASAAHKYPGNLKAFLDETSDTFNDGWSELEALVRLECHRCEVTIDATNAIFGEADSFSIWTDDGFTQRFNRAIFDIMTYCLRDPAVRDAALLTGATVKDAFIDLCEGNSRFIQALTTTTKSKRATATRFVLWADVLQQVTGCDVDVPSEFRSELDYTAD